MYTTGVTYNVTSCENANPPTTAMPNGRRVSDPIPDANATGSVPTNAATVVIDRPESHVRRIDDRLLRRLPFLLGFTAKSTIMIAFFFTIPINNDADEREDR